MATTLSLRQSGRKKSVFVELDQYQYTFTSAKKSGYQLISVALSRGQANIGSVEIYSTGVKIQLVNQKNKQKAGRFETCIPVPPGSPGPTFPGPECPDKWPIPGWPIPTPPGPRDLFLIRIVGRGIKTRAASVANKEQLIQFLEEAAPDVEKRVETGTVKELGGLTVLNQKFREDASFRRDLQDTLLKADAPVIQKTREAREKKSTADKVGDVANAACAASGAAGPAAAAVVCSFALGYAVAGLIWG